MFFFFEANNTTKGTQERGPLFRKLAGLGGVLIVNAGII